MPNRRKRRSVRGLLGWFGIALVSAGICHSDPTPAERAHASSVQTTQDVSQAPPVRAFLDMYCTSCHGRARTIAGVALETLDVADVGRDAHVWERVVRQVRAGLMPPGGLPRTAQATADRIIATIETALDQAAAVRLEPGRSVVHRLNRAEYVNAIRDLLDVEMDAESILPADESLQGFDNIGGVLSISPALLDRYLSAARRISRLAVGDPTIGPAFGSRTYEASEMVFQDARMGEDFPFGSRGGIAIRHRFPLDGEYVARIRLRRNVFGYTRGLGETHLLDLRLDGNRIKLFSIGGDAPGRPAPLSFTGVILGDSAWEAYRLSADDALNVRFSAAAGTRVVTASFIDEPVVEEGVLQPPLTGIGYSIDESRSAPSGPWAPAVGSVAIDGPHAARGPGDTESRNRLFICRPGRPGDEEACARRILATLARRAYRRLPTEREIQLLLEFFATGRRRSGFEGGIQLALERVLVDPSFLLRLEHDPDQVARGAAYRISDVELASRLSFFLWSSIPDSELLDLAIGDRLRDPMVLQDQVGRMLADSRSRALVDNFFGQWLSLRRLSEATPDPELFSDFDGNLREAFERETKLFVESQIRENRRLPELLTADESFVNERLARHYEIPNIYGSHFRRVAMSHPERVGLLGHGSILTITSYPTRTSPVVRGRWLLDTFLGTPPPPPPPDIPALPDGPDAGRPLTARERTERHRRNPACASCHVRMDPLGFALEGFDAIGRRRSIGEDGAAIDASAVLPDGARFQGVAGLRQYLLSRPDELTRTIVEKLLTYATGRTVQYYDMPAVRAIVREAASADYRWSAVILATVKSVPFQMRRSEW
jgi:hypothetical protein